MWFINRKINIVRSGILTGMVDSHSHLMWGVDDGSKDVELTGQMIAAMQSIGIKSAFTTPHIMSGLPENTSLKLTERFRNIILPVVQELGFELRLAGEYMLDEQFMDKFSSGIPLSYDGKHILVEISTMAIPTNLEELVFEICSSGYIPVLAHPERYAFGEFTQYKRLSDMGCKFQLNILSLSEFYGKNTKARANVLLESGMYTFLGTDAHSPSMLKRIEQVNISAQKAPFLEKLVADNNRLLGSKP